MRGSRGRRVQRGAIHHANLAPRRAIPNFPRPGAATRADRGQIAELGPLFDDDIFLDDAGRSDIGLCADVDRADNEFVSLDPRIGEIGVRSDTRAGPNRDQIGRARLDLADERVLADFRPERH